MVILANKVCNINKNHINMTNTFRFKNLAEKIFLAPDQKN